MRDQEIIGLWEAYQQVHSQPQEEVEQLDEAEVERDPYTNPKTGKPHTYASRQAALKPKAKAPERVTKPTKNPRLMKNAGPARLHNPTEEVETDLFDIILEHLVAEGYAETNEAALAIMANMSEEWKQDIMEISQKTATRAYAASSTGEFEGQDSPRDVKRTDNLRKHIKRKFGDKAAKHADRAAHSMTFGRNSKFTKMPPKP